MFSAITDIERLLKICKLQEEALKTIQAREGATMLGHCCVHNTCRETFDSDGNEYGCSHQYGVLRGFSECASEARQARAEVDKIAKGEG